MSCHPILNEALKSYGTFHSESGRVAVMPTQPCLDRGEEILDFLEQVELYPDMAYFDQQNFNHGDLILHWKRKPRLGHRDGFFRAEMVLRIDFNGMGAVTRHRWNVKYYFTSQTFDYISKNHGGLLYLEELIRENFNAPCIDVFGEEDE